MNPEPDRSPGDPRESGGEAPKAEGPRVEATPQTVEALVRKRMSDSLGGRRGMLEAGLPGLAFTVLWLIVKDIQVALIGGAGVAAVALVIRLVQRSTLQYVANAIFGILIGWGVVRLAQSMGGSEQEQALAFFLPGILISLCYTVVMAASCLAGWPFFGFLLGSVTGDALAWHEDKQIVKLCARLTWLFLAPGAFGVAIQGPIWLLGWSGTIDPDLAVLLLGILRTGLGWALRIACYGAMIWLLARNHTPLERHPETA
ncbi:DUF3159 domain-containing protein [Nocardioides insulae]|uniref:DUF3159 domain-containing protein n=1 Tax=Nocardioides insulae TaxID=394734 RepID=UPI00041DB66C|nr:DUF3159 domain-containing protein [Nocardioides insulae]